MPPAQPPVQSLSAQQPTLASPQKKYLKNLAIIVAVVITLLAIVAVVRPGLIRKIFTNAPLADQNSIAAVGGATASAGNLQFLWGVSGTGPSNNNEADGVAVDNAGNVYASGIFSNTVTIGDGLLKLTSRGVGDIFVIKFDKRGKMLWHHEYGSTGDDNAFDLDVDREGNVLLNGWFSGSVDFGGKVLTSLGGRDQFLVKLSPNGDVLWAKNFGSTSEDGGNEVETDDAGNIYASALSVGAFAADSFSFKNNGQRDSYLMKVSPSGKVLWVRGTSGSGNERLRAVSVDSAGNVYGGYEFSGTLKIGSATYAGKGGLDGVIVKWDESGNQIWSDSVSSTGDDMVRGITPGPGGSFYVTGTYGPNADAFGRGLSSVTSGKDTYLAKFSATNELELILTLESSSNAKDGGSGGGEIDSGSDGSVAFSTDAEPGTVIKRDGAPLLTLPTAARRQALLLLIDPSGNILSSSLPTALTESSGQTVGVSDSGAYVAQVIGFSNTLTYGSQTFTGTKGYKSFLIADFAVGASGAIVNNWNGTAPPLGPLSSASADDAEKIGLLQRLIEVLKNLLQALIGREGGATPGSTSEQKPGFATGGSSSASGSGVPGKSTTLSLTFGGAERTYILHTPSGYDRSKRYPLMISYHGAGGTGAGHEQKTGFDAVADENGFFVAYPSAVQGDWKITGGSNDIEFSKALIGAIESSYSIDSSRVYVSGFSAGGGMAQAMACVATDTIAGMAYASNTLGPKKAEQCKPPLPITIVGFSGTADVGSEADPRNNYSSQQTAEFWVSQNGCATTPIITHFPDTLTDGRKVTDTKQVWSGCKNDVTVTLYTIKGGGHAWPGGVPSENETDIKVGSADLDASRVIWDTLGVYRR